MPNAHTIEVLNIIAKHRRVPENEIKDHSATEFSNKTVETVDAMVAQEKKIRIVVPAFPLKSAVREKTLSDSPDMAELVSLKYLNDICQKIQEVYSPGAEIIIYTDGFAFADVLPPDLYTAEKRTNYLSQLNNMIAQNNLTNIKVINLEGTVNLNEYAETDASFAGRIKKPKTDADINCLNLYRGQKHFFSNELKMADPKKTKSKIDKESSTIAHGVARMSSALSDYLSIIEPEAVRLSCHPKTVASDKIGIWFNEDHSPGGTPWHNAAVYKETNNKCVVSFMKAQEAREDGYILKTDKNEKPSHFVSEDVYRHACMVQTFFKAAHNKIMADKAKVESLQENGVTLS